MIDMKQFHMDTGTNNDDLDILDPDVVAKYRRQMINDIKSTLRERNLREINTIIKNK